MEASRRVHRCLNFLQEEVDELAQTDRVRAITCEWGLNVRAQSNTHVLTKTPS